jgi:hypothetical protein
MRACREHLILFVFLASYLAGIIITIKTRSYTNSSDVLYRLLNIVQLHTDMLIWARERLHHPKPVLFKYYCPL